ncbi:hypothetical protein [Streptomyces silvisoli]|uniref:Uncharacterized protein n=1 Tax=Streptomyces silvisoli TaxID=3034235 RepID=A0ABT5ZFJ5_9ACTN|nr:hypothetical protein [Streptomyces silvisoli]MDF3288354.1 hypothetical protein [Streptomyces silvisoli]
MPTKPDPAKKAQAAAEAIRTLNHITLNGKLTAPQISSTVQALTALTDRMPQTLLQLADQLDQRARQDEICMDTGEHPAKPVSTALAALATATGCLAELSNALHQAASPLFSMAHQDAAAARTNR